MRNGGESGCECQYQNPKSPKTLLKTPQKQQPTVNQIPNPKYKASTGPFFFHLACFHPPSVTLLVLSSCWKTLNNVGHCRFSWSQEERLTSNSLPVPYDVDYSALVRSGTVFLHSFRNSDQKTVPVGLIARWLLWNVTFHRHFLWKCLYFDLVLNLFEVM